MKQYLISTPMPNKTRSSGSRHKLMYERFDTIAYGRMLRGIERAANSTLTIAGCVRNIAPGVLKRNINRLKNIGKKFKDYQIVIYENDSYKPTKEALSKLDGVIIQSENLGIPKLGDGRDYQRVYMICQARNKYVKLMKLHDYIMIIDLDIMDWRTDGIFNSLGQNKWDMIGANGAQVLPDKRAVYYDTFALIEKNMKEYVIGEECPLFPINAPLHPVYCCFGGIGLYTKEAFESGEYYSPMKINGTIHPDHCGLATRMRLKGKDRIFINPNMVVMR